MPGPKSTPNRAGSRIEGVYLGTADPAINVARIERRVLENTGHRVDPARVPERHKYSLSNLRRTVERFDQLEVLDNSRDDPLGIAVPVEQCCLERGEVRSRLPDGEIEPWGATRLARVERSLAEMGRIAERRRRAAQERGGHGH